MLCPSSHCIRSEFPLRCYMEGQTRLQTWIHVLRIDEYEHLDFLWAIGVERTVIPAVIGVLDKYAPVAPQNVGGARANESLESPALTQWNKREASLSATSERGEHFFVPTPSLVERLEDLATSAGRDSMISDVQRMMDLGRVGSQTFQSAASPNVRSSRIGGRLSIARLLQESATPDGAVDGATSDLDLERDFGAGVVRTKSGKLEVKPIPNVGSAPQGKQFYRAGSIEGILRSRYPDSSEAEKSPKRGRQK
ncbi:hypothetical protein M427DRAFT_353610 [Gonapodya prolifera JEL478]|uniref:Uncharacterized protein n=1 Tax=Gonapodya prolifera (strain JEL478) TaxID=1344416 RepID=A0A139ACL8_GONPJ|nr:hypothetical protein M427DRAFT_353610 [Gonapodya prolifera JEL478]|eukprot:KXS14324.1 hypothetical protein M427DRAFT_353610 [Gonapodya prolifera JEL478]